MLAWFNFLIMYGSYSPPYKGGAGGGSFYRFTLTL